VLGVLDQITIIIQKTKLEATIISVGFLLKGTAFGMSDPISLSERDQSKKDLSSSLR
jgi:hypothetical protein